MQYRFQHTENKHQHKHGFYIGDLVFGANDGIITTFAVIAGAAGAALSAGPVVILGLATLIADGISMGVSSYLSLRSKLDFQIQQRVKEEKEIEEFPKEEKAEVRVILMKWGVREEQLGEAVDAITSNKKKWVDLMMKEELDIVEIKIDEPYKHGTATFFAFVIAGFLPLMPYVFGVPEDIQFMYAVFATGLALFVVGAARTFITGTRWFYSGLQMLFVGGIAATAAYVIGGFVKAIFGIVV